MIRNLVAAAVVVLIASGVYWFGFRAPGGPDASAPKVLYYKDPMGGPDKSPVPKKDSMGMDYLPVYAEAAASGAPQPEAKGRILYYRNPMGLADTSRRPKKDSMGMDYIPVYEHEIATPGIVQIDPARLQRAGVRTEPATLRSISQGIQATGSVALDESRYAVVTPRTEGFVERVFVGASGLAVKAGQPLIDVYSPELVQLQDEHRLARESSGGGDTGASFAESALKRLQNLGMSPAQIRGIAAGHYQRTLSLSAPISGVVVKKNVVLGQRFMPGDQLYEIADLSSVWIVAKVFEHDLPAVRIGTDVRISVTALSERSYDGKVAFVAPQIDPATRTADVRINVANSDGALRADMFATVTILTAMPVSVIAIPTSAIIDSGTRQVVLVAKGDGRFEPRDVKIGARGDGYTAIRDGVKAGEAVVTEAAFLIDAESNLRAALQSIAPTTSESKQ